MSRQMNLIFVRHAHRDTSDRMADNGLSEKGHKQSRAIANYLKAYLRNDPNNVASDSKTMIFSSPKKRCIETVEPLARQLKTEIQVHSGLTEQLGTESTSSFIKRCQKFLKELETLGDSTQDTELSIVLCSHGDWLPVGLKLTIGIELDFQKGACAIIHEGRLVSFLQPEDLKRID